MDKVLLSEVGVREGISKKALYNIVASMKYCPVKQWRDWIFIKEGKYWYGIKTVEQLRLYGEGSQTQESP